MVSVQWVPVRLKRPTRVDQNVCAEPLHTQNFTTGMGISKENLAINFLDLPNLYHFQIIKRIF